MPSSALLLLLLLVTVSPVICFPHLGSAKPPFHVVKALRTLRQEVPYSPQFQHAGTQHRLTATAVGGILVPAEVDAARKLHREAHIVELVRDWTLSPVMASSSKTK
ncbi:hypothetical protein CALVIDRAFT_249954 [Calocera viscosa TUFC12733]|uniref:Inhibitor I9 domain-containing protein n=1 Tax=Calocera viscosa (strain TUFC12733) TaxID=1330018 RepID=A0A167JDW0_CALVF|nr:hypothetical protein CALVIDRAFT_249954 [Calocera viscosa TUFC12733]